MTNDTSTFKFKTNLKKRIYATLLDYGLFLVASYAYITFFGHDNDEGGKTVNGVLTLPLPTAWFIYFVIVETFYGATLGHYSFDLKVLSLDRGEVAFEQVVKRHLLDLIDVFLYGIPAIIAIRNSEKHQRLGDMWAKTIVVDTTDSEQYLVEKL
jgi:uncharacterized RDD family membrane protein YckC